MHRPGNELRKRTVWRSGFAAVITVAALAVACERTPAGPNAKALNPSTRKSSSGESGENQATQERTYGTAVPLGHGSARSYLVTEHGQPQELGIALSEDALYGLPADPAVMSYSYLLPLPDGNPTQYKIVELNWNPMGHPPPMVYTVPHFDFHFYVIPLAERDAILPTDPAFAMKAGNLPPAEFRTPGWIAPPGPPVENAVPRMGVHWINPSSPEFQGQPFTRTFIFGAWDGKFHFYEPMVARDYLLGKPDDVVDLPAAAQYTPAGWYPGAYRVSWDEETREWHVAITRLAPAGGLE